MKHHASPASWSQYRALPDSVRELADRSFALLKSDSRHPSLHFKQVENYWSVRVGMHHRAIGIGVSDGVLWFWIGTHAENDRMVG